MTKFTEHLKKEYGIKMKDIAEWFNITPNTFYSTPAKSKYLNALEQFYNHIKQTK